MIIFFSISRCHINFVIFNDVSLVTAGSLQMFIII